MFTNLADELGPPVDVQKFVWKMIKFVWPHVHKFW